jgi:hypothetical protein
MSKRIIPLNRFNYVIEIKGLNNFLVQEVILPIKDFTVVTSKGKTKVAGKTNIGDLVLKKLILDTASDTWAFDWFEKVKKTKDKKSHKDYFKTIIIHLQDQTAKTITTYKLTDCFIKRINITSLQSGKSNDYRMMEEITISVNDFSIQKTKKQKEIKAIGKPAGSDI